MGVRGVPPRTWWDCQEVLWEASFIMQCVMLESATPTARKVPSAHCRSHVLKPSEWRKRKVPARGGGVAEVAVHFINVCRAANRTQLVDMPSWTPRLPISFQAGTSIAPQEVCGWHALLSSHLRGR